MVASHHCRLPTCLPVAQRHWNHSASVPTIPPTPHSARGSVAASSNRNGTAPELQKYLDLAEGHVKRAKACKEARVKANKRISDLVTVDAPGEVEWVDLVLQGGGMLGIGLVGYCYVLEQLGIRFRGLGGTSAGAINALLIAAVRKSPRDESSQVLLKILSNTDFASFMDNPHASRILTDLIDKKILNHPSPVDSIAFMNTVLLNTSSVISTLFRKRGLHTGEVFLTWIKDVLAQNGVKTLDDLNQRLEFPPGMPLKNAATGRSLEKMPVPDANAHGRGLLKLIASDITTQSKVLFPEDADLYYKNPNVVNPGEFARASMSIPIFFQPFEAKDMPTACPTEADAQMRWQQRKGYYGKPPSEVTFVDGGTLSNFPVREFHYPGVPLIPTFAVQLGWDRRAAQETDSFIKFYEAVNTTSRRMLDHEFELENPEYSKLSGVVDTDGDRDGDGKRDRPGFSWLNFKMSDDQKQELFARGAEAAADFYCKFDWDAYKVSRQLARDLKEKEEAINSA